MTAATKDRAASARLWEEVRGLIPDEAPGVGKTWLREKTGISRPTLDNYFIKGFQPPTENMDRIARALGVEPTRLWLRWLDIPLPNDALVRIADALERAYPPTLQTPALGEPRPTQPRRASRSAERQAGQTIEPSGRQESGTP